ncbi:flagellar hook protein FlgE [Pseudorhodoferax sp. Leaf265]|jgi:flagellar hook protein FlgE|uniref:flagellar hook protein FlgE n=1 Tax=Pseudorhodoferax sp. Leaf265 TaxID=1736315 RepID=UPI00070224F9|nr:flagellar hook-basal body complex protein [Pseudorhodoferax sp. Leaf265]KQP06456.1 flagellar biosynthesis protein FlgE [Pseudorhodoferax sp. Leaf265]
MSFEIALSGINAINTSLDSISNNIANAGTYGFKSTRANFASLYAGSQPAGAQINSLTQSIDIGGGAMTTGRGLDAMVQGRGFFVTKESSGVEVYTRVGIFGTDQDGYLVDASNRRVQGYAVMRDANGVPVDGAGLGAMGDLQVPSGQVAALATSRMQYVSNLSSDWVAPTAAFDPTNPLTYNSSDVSVVYDSLGSQHTVTQYFVKTATNQVTVHYTFDGVANGTPQALNFGPGGQLATVPAVTLTATPAGATPMSIALDYTGTTQYAGDSRPSVNAPNGYASGTRVNVTLSEDGSVIAEYSNGQKQKVGTVALATFPNEQALQAISDTSWTTTSNSGTPLYATPGTGMAGELTVGAIEQSNVDMTSELVNLMTSQRNYQANTKVISTADDMMQSLMQAV